MGTLIAGLIVWGMISLPLGIVIGRIIESPDDGDEYDRW